MWSIVLFLAVGFLLGMGLAFLLSKSAFISDLISADESKINFGAVAAGISLLASIGWVSWIVYKTSVLPSLDGISLFIGTMYGLSKVKDIVHAAKGQPPTQGGFARLGVLFGIVALILAVSFTFYGCKTAAVIEQISHPVETVTVQGAPVQEVQPSKTMDRTDVPVGVDPDKVILHVSDSEGNEVWAVKTGVLGTGKPKVYTKAAVAPAPKKGEPPAPAPVNDLKTDIAKPSHAWMWWLVGIVGFFALLWFGNKALTGFFGFNPIAMIGGFFAAIVKKLTPGVKTATANVEAQAKSEATALQAKAETAASGLLKRLWEKIKALIK